MTGPSKVSQWAEACRGENKRAETEKRIIKKILERC